MSASGRPSDSGAFKINPPFRADHVGSLLRPAELTAAHRQLSQRALSPAAFQAILERAIREVVALQEEAGLTSITDGEFRRASYWSHFVEAIEGMTVREADFLFRDDRGTQRFTAPFTIGKLRRTRPIAVEEFSFLKSITGHTPKITMPSPATMHFWLGRAGVDRAAYPDEDGFFSDLASIYRDEIRDLEGAGARYIQIDDVPLAMLCDPSVREYVQSRGEAPDLLIEKYVALTNEALEGVSEATTIAMHLCRGNYKGRWLSEGGYGYIAESLFNQVRVDAYFLEYDSARAGDFSPLAFVPGNKVVVLGLVSTKTPQLESEDELERRVMEASSYVPLERLALSPQCGFASTVGGNPLVIEDQKRKLDLLVKTARRIWS
jgi:5-methyltetrahydropteroyltriglutamate--homocysteine methyltransferase